MCYLVFTHSMRSSPSSQATTTISSSSGGSGGSSPTTTVSSTGPTSTAAPAGDPFTGYTVFLSPNYASEVAAAAANITDSTLKAKAASVANIPTFIWFDQVAKVPTLGTYLSQASALGKSNGQKYIVPIVVYDLPDRDCAALASNGEFSIANNGLANYKNYIDQIVAQVKSGSSYAVHWYLFH
jgi:cellulose 1,4-beta-cellobiosidase